MLVGEYEYGNELGIGSPDAYSVLEIAEMFRSLIEVLPERRGNRMTLEVITDKTCALSWSPKNSIREYIEVLRANNWRAS